MYNINTIATAINIIFGQRIEEGYFEFKSCHMVVHA